MSKKKKSLSVYVLCGPSHDSKQKIQYVHVPIYHFLSSCSETSLILLAASLLSLGLNSPEIICLMCCFFLHLSLFFIFFSRPHLQDQVESLPTIATTKKDHVQGQTSITPLNRKEELQTKVSQNRAEDWRKGGAAEMDRGGGRGGWSWTVGESRCTAQWVRQKQEYRSTRPW